MHTPGLKLRSSPVTFTPPTLSHTHHSVSSLLSPPLSLPAPPPQSLSVAAPSPCSLSILSLSLSHCSLPLDTLSQCSRCSLSRYSRNSPPPSPSLSLSASFFLIIACIFRPFYSSGSSRSLTACVSRSFSAVLVNQLIPYFHVVGMSQYGQGVNPYGSGASEPMTPYSSSDRSSASGGAPALPAASPSSISRSSSSSSQPEQSQEPEVGPPCLSVAILRWNR